MSPNPLMKHPPSRPAKVYATERKGPHLDWQNRFISVESVEGGQTLKRTLWAMTFAATDALQSCCNTHICRYVNRTVMIMADIKLKKHWRAQHGPSFMFSPITSASFCGEE